MPYNPMDFFKMGQEQGKAKRSTFGMTTDTMADNFEKRSNIDLMANKQLGVNVLSKAAEMGLEDMQQQRYLGALGGALGQGGGAGGWMPKEIKAGGITFANPEYANKVREGQYEQMVQRKVQEKLSMGIPADQAGRLESSLEGVRAVQHMRKLLFPDGTPESFKRSTAFKANFFGKPAPVGEEARNVFRRAGQAVAGKLLIQSGVAVRPEEYNRMIEQHIATLYSNPNEAYKALDELEAFHRGFIGKVDPKSYFHKPEEMEYNYMYNQIPQQRADTAKDSSSTSATGNYEILHDPVNDSYARVYDDGTVVEVTEDGEEI